MYFIEARLRGIRLVKGKVKDCNVSYLFKKMDFKSVYDDAIKESKNDLNTITGVVSLKVKKCNEFIAKSTDEDAKIFEVKAFVLDFDTDKKTKQTFIVVADTLDEAKEIVQDYSSTIESIVSVKETDILRII